MVAGAAGVVLGRLELNLVFPKIAMSTPNFLSGTSEIEVLSFLKNVKNGRFSGQNQGVNNLRIRVNMLS
jgi:hypothetical protein